MMKPRSMPRLLAILGFGLAACRSSGSSPATTDGPAHDTTPGVDTLGSVATVKSIRMNQPTTGNTVTLANVVVVSRVTSKKGGSIWIQDQGGGQYAGIHVFCNYGGASPNCTMTQAQFDALAVGAVINLTGKFNSFLLSTAPAGAQPQLEIESPTIMDTGTTMTPVAVAVTADLVAKSNYLPGTADPYKGAYVHVTGAFPVSSVTAPEFSQNCTSSTGTAGTTFSGFEVAGGGQTLAVGLGFYNTLTYCIPQCGYPCTNQVTNQAFTGVTGVVEADYNKNGMVYLRISPVTDADLPHP